MTQRIYTVARMHKREVTKAQTKGPDDIIQVVAIKPVIKHLFEIEVAEELCFAMNLEAKDMWPGEDRQYVVLNMAEGVGL